MAGITLRDYIREIEKQIDGKRYDEAIAHCHYILQSYPKAVEVYRLLGKAFLENQRYGDAADIFQRVLSALPDDFVSHAGMSIIREDEGNLDEAIWHMERAFDIQPANSALQEELRRMYGRRDNVEPPKIRLTRSALARMYFKGELYPQAIAETRAALAESPDRLDLLALLTEIYAGAGQKADAVEVAAKLARKLPYCIIANRVLYETLRSTERDAEAQTYLQRLNQVEPYSAYVSETYPTLESVPDSSIRIEKLEWKVGQTAAGKSGQPTWAASLGVNLNELSPAGENQLPDWLGSQTDDESTPAFSLESDTSMDLGFDWDEAAPPAAEIAAAGQEQPPSSESGEAIPDWLKDLGWAPASSESRDAEANYHFEEALGTEAVESEINAAELSSNELSIDSLLADDASAGSLESAEMPDWLRNLAPEHAEDEPQADENLTPWLDKLFTQAGDEPGAAPGTSAEAPAMSSETAATPEEEGLPDWMSAGLATGALRAELGTPAKPEAVEPASDMPDWLREIEGKAEVFPATGETDWMQVGAGNGETMTEPPGEAPEELPAWLLGEESETQPAEGEPAGEGAAPDTSQLPAWLFEENEQELAAASTVLPQDMPTEGDEESLPTWLFEGDSAPVLSSNEELPEEHPEPAAQPADEELPAWLSSEEQPAAAEAPEPEPAGEGLPAWLLGEDQTTPQEEPAAGQAEEEIPEWLLGEMTTVISTEAAAQPSDEELPTWLLGDEQPAGEAPAAQPAEEELPAWLLDEERPGEAEEPEAEPAAEGLPAWLLEETPDAAAAESAEQPAEEETPAWLLGEETLASQPVESELPDWLAGMGIQEQRPPEAEAAEEELPEWLSTEEEPAAQETSFDEIPEWLRTGALASAAGDAADWLAAEPQPVGSEASLEAEAASEAELPPPAETPVEPEQPARPARMPDLAEAFAWLALMMTPIQPEVQPAPAATEEPAIETTVEEAAPPETALPGPEPAEAMPVETEIPTFEPAETETIETPAAETASTAETSVSTPPASEAGVFDFPLDSDDAFAWLESLAVKQGAQEALLLTPEERAEKPPEWVQHAAEEVAAEPETETPPGEQEPDEQPSLPEDTSELKTGALPTLPEDTSELKTGELPTLFEISGEPPVEPTADAPGERIEDAFSPWATESETAPEEPEEPITTRLGDQIMPPAAIELETAEEMEEQVWAPDEEAASPSEAAETQADTLGETATEPLPRVTWMADTGDIEAASAEIELVVDEELSTPTEKLPNARAAEDVETPATEDAPPLPDWLAGVDSERPPDMPEWRLPTFTRRRYDLNLASLVELERLPGIGFIMAQRIVDYRDAHGPFEHVEDLLQVPEFSRYTLEIIRDNLFVIPTAEQPVRAQPISVRPSTRRPGKSAAAPADNTPASVPPAPASEVPAPEAVSTGRQSQRIPATQPQQSVPAPVLPDSEPPEVIRQARRLTEQGEWDAAQAAYAGLLQSGQHLDWVIADYVSATQARPNDIDLWQNLGDAYLRANRLKEAMNAYSQAEKLLR